jgi:hypothetical protein
MSSAAGSDQQSLVKGGTLSNSQQPALQPQEDGAAKRKVDEISVSLPDATKKPRAEDQAAPPGSWDCPSCSNCNWPRRSSCNRCGVPKIANASALPPGTDLSQHPAGSWVCTNAMAGCVNVNWPRRTSCKKCQAPKDGMMGGMMGGMAAANPAAAAQQFAPRQMGGQMGGGNWGGGQQQMGMGGQMGGGMSGGMGAGMGGSMGGGMGMGVQHPPGSWNCPCGNVNWPKRTECNTCRAPKAAGAPLAHDPAADMLALMRAGVAGMPAAGAPPMPTGPRPAVRTGAWEGAGASTGVGVGMGQMAFGGAGMAGAWPGAMWPGSPGHGIGMGGGPGMGTGGGGVGGRDGNGGWAAGYGGVLPHGGGGGGHGGGNTRAWRTRRSRRPGGILDLPRLRELELAQTDVVQPLPRPQAGGARPTSLRSAWASRASTTRTRMVA